MSLANSKRLWKHYKKISDEVNADRVADRARLGYNADGRPKTKEERAEDGEGYDVTKEDKTKKEKK